ncbi:MAG: DUF1080 domain-containing protein [Planctomycetes bacterium]|nr:DUF1080 domain-containing protein [Planctomycetota bacterium]
MKRCEIKGLVAVMAIGSLAYSAFAVVGSAAGPVGQETIQLFNGRDLRNFYTWLVDLKYEDPDRVFSVVDTIDGASAIRVSGKHYGAFITKEEFSDYHLVTEFRWGLLTWGGRRDRTKDSGILLHCQGPDGNTGKDFNGPWMQSVECQIIEGGTGDFILVGGHDKEGNHMTPALTVTARKEGNENIYDPDAEPREFPGGRINWFGRDPEWKDVLGFRGKYDVESPDGQWTRLEVICEGDTITNIVNGKVVNKGTKSTLARGKIIFQSEGAEILFRRIDLIPLKK